MDYQIRKCFPHIDSLNGYESPVTLFEIPITDLTTKFNEDTDQWILECVQKTGISIDKEELIKAIQYDRDQYSKGYKNGYEAGYNAAMEGVQSLADFMSNHE